MRREKYGDSDFQIEGQPRRFALIYVSYDQAEEKKGLGIQ